MARKFFNQRVPNKKRTIIQISIITVCVIGVIICFIAANSFNKKKDKKAIVELRDAVYVEINAGIPDKTTFFAELQNVSEDEIEVSFDDVNISKIGDYEVTIKVDKKKYTSTLKVVDTKSPALVTKTLNITKGAQYVANDFVQLCKDNSKHTCTVAFYTSAIDQNGNNIDYTSYTKEGTYIVQIVASDPSGNITSPVSATLIIGKKNNTDIEIEGEKPAYCKYGNDKYDTDKYIVANFVTDKGCALDLNLYQDKTVLAGVNALMEDQTTKLKKEFSKLNIDGTITLNRKTEAVLNKDGKGIVGFTLHMELIIIKNNVEEIAESFYINEKGERVYSINKYNLQ